MGEENTTTTNDNEASESDLSELKAAIEKIKPILKPSTALDEFIHIDLGLVSAAEKPEYQKSLIKVHNAIRSGLITREAFEKQVGIK